VKIEHQRASGLLRPLDIPVWKWDEISMDFPKEQIGLGGGAGANMDEGGDSIGGSGGKGIYGGGEDQGDNGDAGGKDIARSLVTSESVHVGIGTGAGIEILA
nr:transposon Ty3-I Gag-Pol polyprotein [Tanacetum cinerariifolium]